MNAGLPNRMVAIPLVCSWVFLSPAVANAQLLDRFRNLFAPSVPAAIERGLAPEGDLALEIEKLGSVQLTTLREAQAVVQAARALPLAAETHPTKAMSPHLTSVLTLFEGAETASRAAEYLQTHGIPELIRVYDALVGEADEETADELVQLLRVLAMYCTPEGTDRVLDGIKRPIAPDSMWWNSLFSIYVSEHPEAVRFYRELSEQLPSGQIGTALLNQANMRASEDDTFKHPFNTDVGAERLKEWLTSQDFNLASSAVDAIPHLDPSFRAGLFEVAGVHPDKRVRLETARARAEQGEPAAFEQLTEYCLDVSTSRTAQAYLDELEASELIPAEVHEPVFAAKAELSEWLTDTDELGRPPDELRVIDQRELKWFGNDTARPYTLLEYVAKSDDPIEPEQRGLGIVGSMTWTFFDEKVQTLQVEDIYAYQYGWEAQVNDLIEQNHDVDANKEETYRAQWKGGPLTDVDFDGEWIIDEVLGYPQESVACASAKLDGQPGFAVFDGPRSHWYPSDQFAPNMGAWSISKIHIGRVALGFELDVQRTYTPIAEVTIPPQLIVSEYEKRLLELEQGTVQRRLELLASDSPLDKHFAKYIDAMIATGAAEHEQVVEQTFERLIAAARTLPQSKHSDAFDIFATIGNAFPIYAAAVRNDPKKLAARIAELEPLWDHNLGRSSLAIAAYKAGLRDTALRLLQKRIELDDANRHRGEGSAILAEIWQSEGRTAEAKALLIESLQQSIEDVVRLEFDIEEAQADAQRHQDKYRELFPDSAQAELEQAGLAAPIEELIEAAVEATE